MFIMNLAAADLLVLVFCLPATVIQDVTKTWFFGLILCKFVNYIQVNEDVRSIEENAICACFVFFSSRWPANNRDDTFNSYQIFFLINSSSTTKSSNFRLGFEKRFYMSDRVIIRKYWINIRTIFRQFFFLSNRICPYRYRFSHWWPFPSNVIKPSFIHWNLRVLNNVRESWFSPFGFSHFSWFYPVGWLPLNRRNERRSFDCLLSFQTQLWWHLVDNLVIDLKQSI